MTSLTERRTPRILWRVVGAVLFGAIGFVVGLFIIGWPIWKLACRSGEDICGSSAGGLGALIGAAIGLCLGIWLGGKAWRRRRARPTPR